MRTVVAVLRGGASTEYAVSLKSGAAVLAALDLQKYEPRDIFVSREGEWHVHGLPVTPERALRGVDVAFNVLHGEYGEDGQMQRLLDTFGVPYTGADGFASATAFNKQHTKEILAALDVKVPYSIVLDTPNNIEDTAFTIFRSFPHPSVVKPIIGGSSVGVTVAHTLHELQQGLEDAFAFAPKVIVEEFIKGKEATVGIIDDFRGEKMYALFPVEIVPPLGHRFYSWEVKQNGTSMEHIPGRFTEEEKKQLIQIARKAHEGLALSHYSRSDFIVSKRGTYFLETNSAAACELHKESLFNKALHAVGSSLSEFVDHSINLARGRKKG